MAKVLFAQYNNMVKTVPSDRTDQPLSMPILPWRSRCGRPIPYAHRSKTPYKDVAIDGLPISNNISRRLSPAVCLGELTGNPLSARMRGHTKPQNLTAAMHQDQMRLSGPRTNPSMRCRRHDCEE